SETSAPGYNPAVIMVKIGLNNTVRWINADTVPHGIPIPDDSSDANLLSAVAEEMKTHQFLMPGESFQYEFTRPGEYHYHMVPHPWMQGTVIVLPPIP
ncbi:MAG: cupredoxin domain-containing protein, partial [Nitrososphaera sp.]